jgi:carbon monoxide dehydrogenase subunit G
MEFNDTFELEGVSTEEAWLVLSDPMAIQQALPGCKFLTRIDGEAFNFDEHEPEQESETAVEHDPEVVEERAFATGEEYAALMEVGVGSVKPSFETRITIDECDYPSMRASGSGSSSGSAFTMNADMSVSETEDGTKVEWTAEIDISGRVAQMGQRVLNPVANKVVNQFFNNIEEQILALEERNAQEGDVHGEDDVGEESSEEDVESREKSEPTGLTGRIREVLKI